MRALYKRRQEKVCIGAAQSLVRTEAFMKRLTVGLCAGSLILCAGAAWGGKENWKLLSTDEKTNQKYYYDAGSVKKGKGRRRSCNEEDTYPVIKFLLTIFSIIEILL